MRGGRRRVDANQAGIVAALRKAGASVAVTSHLGHGFPDLVVGYVDEEGMGQTILMEIKAGADALTAEEARWHLAWRGGPTVIVRSAEAALTLVGKHGEGHA